MIRQNIMEGSKKRSPIAAAHDDLEFPGMNRNGMNTIAIDILERRDCPALSISLFSNFLLVSGTPSGDLEIVNDPVVDNRVSILDGGNDLGTYDLPEVLYIRTPRRPGSIVVDANDQTIAADVLIDLGRGDGLADPLNAIALVNGNFGGDVRILRGDAGEFYDIGGGTVADAATVGGHVTILGQSGPEVNVFSHTDGSQILGDLRLFEIEDVLTDATTTPSVVAGDLQLSNLRPGDNLITLSGEVLGDVRLQTRASDDRIFLAPTPGVLGSGRVAGDLVVDLGSYRFLGDVVQLDPGSTVDGSVDIRGDNGPLLGLFPGFDVVNDATVGGDFRIDVGDGGLLYSGLFDVIGGDLVIRAGNGGEIPGGNAVGESGIVQGDIDLEFQDGFNVATLDGTVGGDVRYRGGNGENSLVLFTDLQGDVSVNVGNGFNPTLFTLSTGFTISGNLRIQTGNGTNSSQVENSVLGRFTYNGGNGDDSIVLIGSTAAYNVDFDLNGGNDVVNFNDNPVRIRGILDGGSGTNLLTDSGSVVKQTPITIANFIES